MLLDGKDKPALNFSAFLRNGCYMVIAIWNDGISKPQWCPLQPSRTGNLSMTNFIDPQSHFLSVKQVALRYGVSTDTIYRWRRDSTIPKPFKLSNGTTRWRLSDLTSHDGKLNTCFAMQ
jgi:prophage regulatory protein